MMQSLLSAVTPRAGAATSPPCFFFYVLIDLMMDLNMN